MGSDVAVVLLVGLAVFAGSIVQGSAGFGVSLIGVPMMTLVDPSLMPGGMLVVGTLLTAFTLRRESRHADGRKAMVMLAGRLLGTFGRSLGDQRAVDVLALDRYRLFRPARGGPRGGAA